MEKKNIEYVDVFIVTEKEDKKALDELYEIREIVIKSLEDMLKDIEESAKKDDRRPYMSEKDFRVLKTQDGYALNVPKDYKEVCLIIGTAYLAKTNPTTHVWYLEESGICDVEREISVVDEYINSHDKNTNL